MPKQRRALRIESDVLEDARGDHARAAIAASGNAITMAAKKILDALNQEVAA